MKKLIFLAFMLAATALYANNVQLTNISVSNNVSNTGKVIEFDLSWENSWRTASTNNYDGVWVFFKFKDNDGVWRHLRFTTGNVTLPAGAAHDFGGNPGLPGIGMYILRSSNGAGNVNFTNISAGIQSMPGTFEVRGFALEMVYIPQDSFWVGDGSTTTSGSFQEGNSGNPYQVTGTSITIGTGTGNLNDPYPGTGAIPPFTGTLTSFPTGYNAFWMMKYELSLGAYRDYLNTLTYPQQASHFLSSTTPESGANTLILYNHVSVGFFRGNIKIRTNGNNATQLPAVLGCDTDGDNIYNEASDGEWLALGGIGWRDGAAYLDWAGLRPMTELEYEKTCRGPLTPVAGEFAWGNDQIATLPYMLSSHYQAGENVTNAPAAIGNASYFLTAYTNNNIANIRGGIFATAISTRISAGAGYYGNMELSGNQWEFCVFTTYASGRSYTGKLGDGLLTTDGFANENKWPGINNNNDHTVANTNFAGSVGVTGNAGIHFKGGQFLDASDSLRVSTRGLYGSPGAGKNVMGIRGIRDANSYGQANKIWFVIHAVVMPVVSPCIFTIHRGQ